MSLGLWVPFQPRLEMGICVRMRLSVNTHGSPTRPLRTLVLPEWKCQPVAMVS